MAHAWRSRGPAPPAFRSPPASDFRALLWVSPLPRIPSSPAYRQNAPCVHKIQSLNRIRQRIGRIGKASGRDLGIVLKLRGGDEDPGRDLRACLVASADALDRSNSRDD